jgi:hypothetical protein
MNVRVNCPRLFAIMAEINLKQLPFILPNAKLQQQANGLM